MLGQLCDHSTTWTHMCRMAYVRNEQAMAVKPGWMAWPADSAGCMAGANRLTPSLIARGCNMYNLKKYVYIF